MLDELKARAEQAVELARAAGASDAWASASRSREVEVSFRDGELEKLQESTSRSLSLRLYVDGRYSTHGTTDLREDRLDAFVKEAVAMTRALQPDPFRQIPDPALFEGRPDQDLGVVDPAVAALTPDQRRARCERMDALAHADERVISATSGMSDQHALSAAASSNGFSGVAESTSAWAGTEITVRDAGDKRPEEWFWAGGRTLDRLPDADVLSRTCLEMALARLGAVKGPTTRTAMVIHPRVAAGIVRRLLGPADARSVQQERSFLAQKTGEQVVSDKLSITDDPLIVGGLASRHFDSEGISAKAMPILEGGVLRNLYVDTYYGKKAGLTPTTGDPSNQVVTLGDKDLAALMREVGDGILVTSWLGGNSDSTTGAFSLGVSGHVIRGGVASEPVGEMNVTGDLLGLFSNLVAVGNDPWIYGRLLCPTLVFEGVQFSGA